jgi:propanol-preferring alcohol dehydrogenase
MRLYSRGNLMQAMVLKEADLIENAPLHLQEIPEPQIGLKDILIRVQACGICHTDLHTIEGELPLPKLPLVPGHQVVGVVEKKGEYANRFKLGDKVGIAWLNSTCGKCEFCKSGRENLCENAKFTGYHVDGGYTGNCLISEDFAYPVSDKLSPAETAPLLCAGIIGYRALRLSEIKPGGRLGLYGFGASAHIAIQIATYWKCEVYVFSRSTEHQKLALELGAVWTGRAEQIPPKKLDSSIIFAPAGEIIPLALKALNKGGALALAGIYMTPIPQLDYTEHLYYEKTLRSIANSTRRDGEELLKLAAEIPIRTHISVFPLEEANQALQLLKQRKINGAGVLEIPQIKL